MKSCQTFDRISKIFRMYRIKSCDLVNPEILSNQF